MALHYSPATDSFNYVVYNPVVPEKVILDSPISEGGIMDISDWADSVRNGIPIVKETIKKEKKSSENLTAPAIESTNYSGLEDLSLEDLIKQENLPVRISSAYRKGSRTKSGHASNHSKLDKHGKSVAHDIVPLNGDFEDLARILYSNPRFVAWLKAKGYGILEETTPGVMARTGATGKHFHIGPDTWALEMTKKRLVKAQGGTKFDFFQVFNPVVVEPKPVRIPYPPDPNDSILNRYSLVPKQEKKTTKTNQNVPFMLREHPDTITVSASGMNNNLDIYHKFGKTNNKFKEFVDVMRPIYQKVLKDRGLPMTALNNLLKQSALEASYGLDPRGKKGFNLGGIKFYNQKGRTGTKHSDGEYYIDFNDLLDYAQYHVDLLTKYGVFNSADVDDYSRRLHGNNPNKMKYSSQTAEGYAKKLRGMISLSKYL